MIKLMHDTLNQSRVLPVIGPFFIICLLGIVSIKAPDLGKDLFIIMLIALPLCWIWKRAGVVISLLLLVLWWGYTSISTNEPLWLFVAWGSSCISMMMIALISEEADELSIRVETENSLCQKRLLVVDSEIEEIKKAYEDTLWNFKKENSSLESSLLELSVAQENKEKLNLHLLQDLRAINSQRDGLLEELFLTRGQVIDLESRLEISCQQMNEFKQRMEPEAGEAEQIADLKSLLSLRETELGVLQTKLVGVIEINHELTQKSDEYLANLVAAKELNDSNQHFVDNIQEDQVIQKAIVKEMNDHIDTLCREKTLLEQTLNKLQLELEKLQNHAKVLTSKVNSQQNDLDAMILHKQQLICLAAEEKEQFQKKLSDLESDHCAALKELTAECKERNKKIDCLEKELTGCRAEKLELAQIRDHLSKDIAQFELRIEQGDATSKLLLRTQAIYRQLQRQFNEKSNILDATRKELFLVNEELLKLQRENLNNQQDLSPEIEDMTAYALTLAQQAKKKEDTLLVEIESLQDIISHLLKQA